MSSKQYLDSITNVFSDEEADVKVTTTSSSSSEASASEDEDDEKKEESEKEEGEVSTQSEAEIDRTNTEEEPMEVEREKYGLEFSFLTILNHRKVLNCIEFQCHIFLVGILRLYNFILV
jgi:CRISPR/Cas system CSM-associated protein Csm3 (group 7 of RAMP superfamily)